MKGIKMSEISFFSESDMKVKSDGTKVVSSEMPLWYNRQMMEELREDISMCEFDIKSGRIAESQLGQTRERLTKLKNRYEEVEKSMPKLDDKFKDKLGKVHKELGARISDAMFSRSDMKKGLADVHEEARRMDTPIIKLGSDMNEIARACNVTPVDGMVSRNQAEKIWKISSRYLGENSNTESLRRD
jgi:archaellum component FlaC